MKFKCFTFFAAAIISCSKPSPEYISGQSNIPVKIEYYKDCRTGLCFAQIDEEGEKAKSHTCVPCDSIAGIITFDCK